jgi:hypothetical protein
VIAPAILEAAAREHLIEEPQRIERLACREGGRIRQLAVAPGRKHGGPERAGTRQLQASRIVQGQIGREQQRIQLRTPEHPILDAPPDRRPGRNVVQPAQGLRLRARRAPGSEKSLQAGRRTLPCGAVEKRKVPLVLAEQPAQE